MPPLILIVLSRLDRGIQSATEMLRLKRGHALVDTLIFTLCVFGAFNITRLIVSSVAEFANCDLPLE